MAPKANIKQEKKDYISSLSDRLKEAKSLVFVNYTGMGVKLQEEFKDKLREVGGNMFVAKNTLVKLALDQAGVDENLSRDEVLKDQTAMILSGEDPVASIQILGKFAADNEIPKIKAGIIEGVYQDQAGIVKVSKLPGREQLYANVVGAVAAPMYSLVGTLQGNIQKLVFILDQHRNSKSS